MDDVKNKVDKDVDENVVKEDTATKLKDDIKNVHFELGHSVGYLKGMLDSEEVTNKVSKKAKITGMFMGAGVVAIGYIVVCGLMTILSNKHHN